MDARLRLLASPLDERGSFAWRARPGEWMERSSCAVVTDAGTLVVDPVDAEGLDEALSALPPVLAVVTLLDRHHRDAAAIAARHGVPRQAPGPLARDGIAPLVATGVLAIPVPAVPGWTEVALWLPDRALLLVPEAVGTAAYYRLPGQRLGLHPVIRLRPPRVLQGVEPETIWSGHGDPVVGDAASALAVALAGARRGIPRAWIHAVRASRASGAPRR